MNADVTDRAIMASTEELLPWTTHLALVRSDLDDQDGIDLRWRIIRIDLARDFPGPVRNVISALTGVRFRRVRKDASKIVRSTSKQLLWRGKTTSLSLYDKGAEIRGNKKRTLEERMLAPPIDAHGRAELRFRGSAGAANLAERLLRMDCPGSIRLPMIVRRGSRSVRVVQRVSLLALHTVLAEELASLSPRVLPPSKAMTAKSIGLWALARDEVLWSHFCACAKSSTVRKYRPAVMAIRQQEHGVDVIAKCYDVSERAAMRTDRVELEDRASA